MNENKEKQNYSDPVKNRAQLQELYQKRDEIYEKTNQLKNASDAQKKEYNECLAEIDQLIEKGANL